MNCLRCKAPLASVSALYNVFHCKSCKKDVHYSTLTVAKACVTCQATPVGTGTTRRVAFFVCNNTGGPQPCVAAVPLAAPVAFDIP